MFCISIFVAPFISKCSRKLALRAQTVLRICNYAHKNNEILQMFLGQLLLCLRDMFTFTLHVFGIFLMELYVYKLLAALFGVRVIYCIDWGRED